MGTARRFARRELGAFLRTRRERRTPAEVGLGVDGRRKTPGLRREEVARLAGVSLTWYTWLEQGRDIGVSGQVLASIARALGLSAAEQQHLFSLAGDRMPASTALGPVDEDTRHFLALLDPCPSWVFDPYFTILAWNRSAAGLLVGLDDLTPERRNAVELVFFDRRAQVMLPDWEAEARRLVSLLRAEVGNNGSDPRFARMVDDLRRRSGAFQRIWDSGDVQAFNPSVRRFRHPTIGLLQLRYLKLDLVGDCRRSVIVHFLPESDPDYPLLRHLYDIGTGGQSLRPGKPAVTDQSPPPHLDVLRGFRVSKESDSA